MNYTVMDRFGEFLLTGKFGITFDLLLWVEIRDTSEKQKIIFECPVSRRHLRNFRLRHKIIKNDFMLLSNDNFVQLSFCQIPS